MSQAQIRPEIRITPVDNLIPYARNARTHSDEQVAQIAADLASIGVNEFRFCLENDCYAVDRNGDMFRVCREQYSKSGRLIRRYETLKLKGSLDVDGYRVYRMRVDGTKKHVKGHRMVMSAWHGPEAGKVVNHCNGNKSDNRLENLEWVTVAQNNAHAIRTGLLNPRLGGRKNRKLFTTDFLSIYILHVHCGFSRANLARSNRVCRQVIDDVIQRVKNVLGDVHAAA